MRIYSLPLGTYLGNSSELTPHLFLIETRSECIPYARDLLLGWRGRAVAENENMAAQQALEVMAES